MSVASLLNQDATIYSNSGSNEYGRDTSNPIGVNVKCRFQNNTRLKTDQKGQTIALLGTVYLNGNAAINTQDRIVIGGVSYKVFSVNGSIDRTGTQRVIRCDLLQWQIT